MRLSRMATGAALVLAALGGPAIASAATASAATDSNAGWQTYRTAPWTDAPGAVR